MVFHFQVEKNSGTFVITSIFIKFMSSRDLVLVEINGEFYVM